MANFSYRFSIYNINGQTHAHVKHFNSLIDPFDRSVSQPDASVPVCRGAESGGERGSGCSHGRSQLHRTGAQHHQQQTQQRRRQHGSAGADRYKGITEISEISFVGEIFSCFFVYMPHLVSREPFVFPSEVF